MAPGSATTIEPCRSPRRFLDAQRAFYAGDPHYVPPLTLADTWVVDPRKNPYFRHAEAGFWLARRDGQVVGRISAARDRLHDDFHGDRVGFFGHFEAADEDTAHALLEHAERWLRERGATELRGPVDLSTNYRCGLLVEGEPGPPFVMMAYNPPEYARHLESYGLAKAKDLLAVLCEAHAAKLERFSRITDRIRKRTGARIRNLSLRDFAAEVEVLWNLYNKIWETNWGFVPMPGDEFRKQAMELKHIAVAELLMMVEVEGEPVAFALSVPDVNVATRACDGRLLPFGWWRFLRALKKTDRARMLTLGVLPEYRGSGIDGLIVEHIVKSLPPRGYPTCEASWVLEDNVGMLRPLEQLGGRVHRRYRIYSKEIVAASSHAGQNDADSP